MHTHTFLGKLLLLVAIGIITISCAPVPAPAPAAPAATSAPAATLAPAATSAPAGTSAPSGNAPQVTIWIGEGPEGQAMVAAADAYNKKFNANIVVQLQGRDTLEEKQKTALASGSPQPDLQFILSYDVPSFAAAGFIDPWDTYLKDHPELNWDTDWFSAAKDESMFDGKIYMLSTDITGEELIYNSELIPTPPKTWDEYLEVAKKFTKSVTPSSPTDYGTAFGGRPAIADESWSIHLWSNGGEILDKDGKVVADSQTAIDSLTWWVALLRTEKVVPPDVTSWAYPEKQVALQNVKIPMASHFEAGLPILNDCKQSPLVCGKMKLARNPAGTKGSVTSVQTLGLTLNSKSANKDEAAKFAFWVVSPEGALIYTKAGGTSPRESIFNNADVASERGSWWKDYSAALSVGHGTIRDAHASELKAILADAVSKAYAGQLAPADALKQAAAAMRKVLGQ